VYVYKVKGELEKNEVCIKTGIIVGVVGRLSTGEAPKVAGTARRK
jgi:hypothetical protein